MIKYMHLLRWDGLVVMLQKKKKSSSSWMEKQNGMMPVTWIPVPPAGLGGGMLQR